MNKPLLAWVRSLSYTKLQEEFDLYCNLQARGVMDEIIQEALAVELDRRDAVGENT
jgi:hypothetical protein